MTHSLPLLPTVCWKLHSTYVYGQMWSKRWGFLSPQLPIRAYHISLRDRLPSTYLLQDEEAKFMRKATESSGTPSLLWPYSEERRSTSRVEDKILQPNHPCPSLRSRFHAGRHKTRRQKVVPPRA